MRTSQRVVLGVIGALALMIVALTLWARFAAPRLPDLSGERTTRSYENTGFDALSVSGQWEVTIERGDAWRVTVELPTELADRIRVEQEGSRLALRTDRDLWFGAFDDDDIALEARITMPALAAIELSGASMLSFTGFEGDRLALTSSGASEIEGAMGRYDTLDLRVSGAGEIDLDGVLVTNASVQTSGAGNVTLNMAGGRLTGSMSGAGNLDYRGTVSEESVSRSGVVSIRHRD